MILPSQNYTHLLHFKSVLALKIMLSWSWTSLKDWKFTHDHQNLGLDMQFILKVPDMIHNIIPQFFFKPTVILVPKV